MLDSEYIIDDSMFAPGGFVDKLKKMTPEELELYVLQRRQERARRGEPPIQISQADLEY